MVWSKRLAGMLALGALWLSGCSDGNADRFIWGRAPVYAPDGATLFYAQNLSTPSERQTFNISVLDAGAIWRIGADGRNLMQLTPSDRGPDFYPTVSPDGTQIAFISGEGGQFDVWAMNADGSNRRRLTNDLSIDTTPAWHPDGRQVIFSSDRSGNADLWLVQVDGSGIEQVTSHPSDEASPEYSPDGSRIAFSSNRDRGNFDIWTMAAAGGDLVQLTSKQPPASELADGGPAWSPDGGTIAFERWVGNWDVFTVPAAGGDPVQLTFDEEHDGDPDFNPTDGTIAFTSSRSGWWQIWTMAPDGSNQRQLTDAPPR